MKSIQVSIDRGTNTVKGLCDHVEVIKGVEVVKLKIVKELTKLSAEEIMTLHRQRWIDILTEGKTAYMVLNSSTSERLFAEMQKKNILAQ